MPPLPCEYGIKAMSEHEERCEISGVYFGSGGCGHATEVKIARDQQFPDCKICGKELNWTLLRPMEVRQDDF